MARRELRSSRRPAPPRCLLRQWCSLAAADRRPARPLPACPAPACRLPGLVRCHHLRPPLLLRVHRAALPGRQRRGELEGGCRRLAPCGQAAHSPLPSSVVTAVPRAGTCVWPAITRTPWRAPAPTAFLLAPADNGHGLQQPVRVLRVPLPSLQRAPRQGSQADAGRHQEP